MKVSERARISGFDLGRSEIKQVWSVYRAPDRPRTRLVIAEELLISMRFEGNGKKEKRRTIMCKVLVRRSAAVPL